MSRLQGNGGHTLIELLVTMSLLALVLGAVTTFWVSFNKTERTNQNQNESQSQARVAQEQISRQLRNLASPDDFQPDAVDAAGDYELVFRTVSDAPKPAGTLNDRNVKRVRYCLSPSQGGNETLWAQEQTWTTANAPATWPSTATCPSTAWGASSAIAQNIVNRELGIPLYTYTPASSPTRNIYGIQTKLSVDVTPGTKSPAPTTLASGVFLRNQNRAPGASCTSVAGTGREIVLNGSASSDPEGRSIKSYEWLDSSGQPLLTGTKAVTGAFASWAAPAAGTYVIKLRVKDYGGLDGVASCAAPAVVP